MIRNIAAAVIGGFCIAAPWMFAFSGHAYALRASLFLGVIQLISSLLAIGKHGWTSWQNWISLLCGVGFIIFPFAFAFSWQISVLYILLGYAAVLLNYYQMNSRA